MRAWVGTRGGGSASGSVYVPKTPENFSYDNDGNQIVDGRWNYTWDAENRLVRMVANTAVGPQQRIDYGYDARGRRISKKVWSNTSGTGSPATYNRFIYDGWNLLAELDGNNTNAIVRCPKCSCGRLRWCCCHPARPADSSRRR